MNDEHEQSTCDRHAYANVHVIAKQKFPTTYCPHYSRQYPLFYYSLLLHGDTNWLQIAVCQVMNINPIIWDCDTLLCSLTEYHYMYNAVVIISS